MAIIKDTKDVTVISYHLGVQGSNLNMLDFNKYLQDQGHKVLFYTQFVHDIYKTIKQSKRPYRFDEVREIKNYQGNKESILVTDFKSLNKLYNDGIKLTCDKMYVIDNNELSYHINKSKEAKFYHKTNVNKIMKSHKYNDVLFLMPPSNINQFKKVYPDLPCEIFFKKIDYEMISKIKYTENDRLWYRFDDIDIEQEMRDKYGNFIETRPEYDEINLWDYKGMIYYRRKHLDYYEQLGRSVFEFIFLA